MTRPACDLRELPRGCNGGPSPAFVARSPRIHSAARGAAFAASEASQPPLSRRCRWRHGAAAAPDGKAAALARLVPLACPGPSSCLAAHPSAFLP